MRARAAACAAHASAAPLTYTAAQRRFAASAGRARAAPPAADDARAKTGENAAARSRSPSRTAAAAPHKGAPKAKRASTASAAAAASAAQAESGSPAPHVLRRFCETLLTGYLETTPTAAGVLRALHKQGAEVFIDHMAFRSFGVAGLGIEAAARPWLDLGYMRRDDMTFLRKKLRATWLSPPDSPPADGDAPLPRVFVSEVDVASLSKRAQAVIARNVARAGPLGPHAALAAALREPLWPAPLRADYELLAKESEYAAWVLAHGFSVNHFTVAVHRLKKGPQRATLTLEDMNALAAAQGAALNAEGGVIKTSEDGLLRQSSTLADSLGVAFAGEEQATQVPGAYLEFAERLPLPEFATLPRSRLREHHRRDGFEAASADKIFQSTDAARKRARDAA